MRWFRTKMRFGVWCALFALAIQFTASFGHVHLPEIARLSGGLLAAAAPDHGPSGAMPSAPAVPAKPPGLAFDYCAICAVINLAGSAVPAAAPILSAPAAFHLVRFWPDADIVSAASPHRFFNARAPPLA